ncbi:MAG: acetyl-CoA carboxylase carboxyltransferase subunit alpha, partial [Hyphomonadaceae bacterium]|nr:acetyl-CoA carboxylase carboxyltransferase subunit alpha [Hyphomonadaceae bacterium]
MTQYLDFEKPIKLIEEQIEELSAKAESAGAAAMSAQLTKLKQNAERLLAEIYAKLDPWQKTLVARHVERPHFKDYIAALVTDFVELAGDRKYAEDAAIVGGMGRFLGRPCMIIGHEKGRTTHERITHNFGMSRPEGYRKAIRLMDMADRFGLPVVTLVDTPGAYPGLGAEERGGAEAIARSTERCLTLGVPMVTVIVGEGGSGGAIAIAAANTVLMLEHAVYSVITPEGAASILFRDAGRAKDAAAAMKITAQDCLEFKVIDGIVKEPLGGAHRAPEQAVAAVGAAVAKALDALAGQDPATLKA